jgi:RNA polymerase sigma factor (sigma-70 family)
VASTGERPDAFEWRDEIGQAIEQLRPHYREAFLLRYVEGLEYAEMAEMTGTKEPALRMRVKRASDQLRELLRDVHVR